MLLRWLRTRRRRALLAQPFPGEWRDTLEANVSHYRRLTADEQARVRNYVRVFVTEKNWEGCGGLEMTDEVRVTIAGQVAILVLALSEQYFDHVLSILVYPTAYVAPGQSINAGGIVLEGDSSRLGEAWYRGPVILSWNDVLAGGRQTNHGRNVVFHEFAHQLDMLNGRTVDGTPPLETVDEARRWTTVMNQHYRQLVEDCEVGRETVLDCYGATSLSEFFAVATESFFERPIPLLERHPALYGIIHDFYRQEPAER